MKRQIASPISSAEAMKKFAALDCKFPRSRAGGGCSCAQSAPN